MGKQFAEIRGHLEVSKRPCAGVDNARNRHLTHFANLLQTAKIPDRESLARATARYLERNASNASSPDPHDDHAQVSFHPHVTKCRCLNTLQVQAALMRPLFDKRMPPPMQDSSTGRTSGLSTSAPSSSHMSSIPRSISMPSIASSQAGTRRSKIPTLNVTKAGAGAGLGEGPGSARSAQSRRASLGAVGSARAALTGRAAAADAATSRRRQSEPGTGSHSPLAGASRPSSTRRLLPSTAGSGTGTGTAGQGRLSRSTSGSGSAAAAPAKKSTAQQQQQQQQRPASASEQVQPKVVPRPVWPEGPATRGFVPASIVLRDSPAQQQQEPGGMPTIIESPDPKKPTSHASSSSTSGARGMTSWGRSPATSTARGPAAGAAQAASGLRRSSLDRTSAAAAAAAASSSSSQGLPGGFPAPTASTTPEPVRHAADSQQLPRARHSSDGNFARSSLQASGEGSLVRRSLVGATGSAPGDVVDLRSSNSFTTTGLSAEASRGSASGLEQQNLMQEPSYSYSSSAQETRTGAVQQLQAASARFAKSMQDLSAKRAARAAPPAGPFAARRSNGSPGSLDDMPLKCLGTAMRSSSGNPSPQQQPAAGSSSARGSSSQAPAGGHPALLLPEDSVLVASPTLAGNSSSRAQHSGGSAAGAAAGSGSPTSSETSAGVVQRLKGLFNKAAQSASSAAPARAPSPARRTNSGRLHQIWPHGNLQQSSEQPDRSQQQLQQQQQPQLVVSVKRTLDFQGQQEARQQLCAHPIETSCGSARSEDSIALSFWPSVPTEHASGAASNPASTAPAAMQDSHTQQPRSSRPAAWADTPAAAQDPPHKSGQQQARQQVQHMREEGEEGMQVRRATSTPAAGSPRSSRAVANLKHLSQARQPRHSLTSGSSTSHLPTTALDADERPLPAPGCAQAAVSSRAAALDKLKQAMVKRHTELLRSSTIFQRCADKHRLCCVLPAGIDGCCGWHPCPAVHHALLLVSSAKYHIPCQGAVCTLTHTAVCWPSCMAHTLTPSCPAHRHTADEVLLSPTSRQRPSSARASLSLRPNHLGSSTSRQFSRSSSSTITSPRSPGARRSLHRTRSGDILDAGDEASSRPAVTPKPFLKRRSSVVASSKLDWSQVTSRVNSRLEDNYIPPAKAGKQRPASAAAPSARKTGSDSGNARGAAAKTSRPGPGPGPGGASARRTGSGGGAPELFMASDLLPSKPKLHRSRSDAGMRQPGSARAGSVYSGAGYEVSRPRLSGSQGGGGTVGARGRQNSAGAQLISARQLSAGGTTANITDRRTGVNIGVPRTPKQPNRGDGAPTSPLDDLLQHVNSLIDDFDNKMKRRSNVY